MLSMLRLAIRLSSLLAARCNELILLSARYEIRAASSEDCVFVPPNLYDVTAP